MWLDESAEAGTVYHDFEGEITYSVVAKVSDLGTADVTSVYTKIYGAITDALRILGVPTDFSSGGTKNCPNLTVKGKKISGSSQTISRGRSSSNMAQCWLALICQKCSRS
jgi:lipoate-protein ligase A